MDGLLAGGPKGLLPPPPPKQLGESAPLHPALPTPLHMVDEEETQEGGGIKSEQGK